MHVGILKSWQTYGLKNKQPTGIREWGFHILFSKYIYLLLYTKIYGMLTEKEMKI